MAQSSPNRTLDEIRTLAVRCAHEGDGAGVLRALVAAWPLCRHPALAAAIERQVHRLPPDPAAIASNQDWQMLASRADPCAVEALLTAPWGQLRDSTLRKRLSALGRFPPDPRIAAFLASLLLRSRDGSEVRAEAERALRLHGHPDPGAERVPLDAQVQSMIEAAASRPLEEGDALLEAILASPDDDGPRFVYADYLMEHGDPLGQFLAAALAPGAALPPSEEKQAWCRRLLGPVDGAQIELNRGFPDRMVVNGQIQGLRRWATLREVIWWYPPDELAGLLPRLGQARLLESLHLLDWITTRAAWMMQALSVLEGTPLREIGLFTHGWDGQRFEAERWPALQRLSLRVPGPPLRLDEAWLGSLSQRALEIKLLPVRITTGELIGLVLGARDRCAPCVTHIRVSNEEDSALRGMEMSFERQSAFRELRLSGVNARNVGSLWRMVTRIQPADIDGIVVETPQWQDPAFRKRLGSALKRLGSLPLELRAPGQER